MKCIDFTLKINKVHAALSCELGGPEHFPFSKTMKVSWMMILTDKEMYCALHSDVWSQ